MGEQICFNKRGPIAVVTIDNPPVNAMSQGVPAGLMAAIDRAESDPEIAAVVIHGAGRNFVAGADIKEFQAAVAGAGPMPELHPALNRIEACSKPVVMALHGSTLGAGLELAMAGHYRVATADAKVGQPEVKIGLIPGAGGTQRLPRLAGVGLAAEMCALGDPIDARAAHDAGIVDEIVDTKDDDELVEAAIAFAQQKAAELAGSPPRRTSERKEKLGSPETALPVLAELRALCNKKRRGQEAPQAAIDAVEAAVELPFKAGCAREAKLFHQRLYSAQSKAMIYAFFGEREVNRSVHVPAGTEPLPLDRIGIVGAGTMGRGIAMALANAGYTVFVSDPNVDAQMDATVQVRNTYARAVRSGRLSQDAADACQARILFQLDLADFDKADLIIEAVPESLELKRTVFAQLDAIAKPGCILASNTSTLNIDALAAATSRSSLVCGMHFFSPAHVMRLLEIVRIEETAPEVLATALALAKKMNKVGVVSENAFGFIGNRMFIPYMDEAQFLVEEGATPEQVDRVLTEFGMAMGPLAVADLSGLDVFHHVEQHRLWPDGFRRPVALNALVAANHLGQKNDFGWYRYENRRAVASPEALEIVRKASTTAGIKQRDVDDQEVLERCLMALINEGGRVLEDQIARSPVEIDMVYLHGYGFPAYRGGPMFYAQELGFYTVCEKLGALEKKWGPRWIASKYFTK